MKEKFIPGKNAMRVELDSAEVTNKCLRHMKKALEKITFLYNAVNDFEEKQYRPLPSDGFPLFIESPEPDPTFSELREDSRDWLFLKGIQEIIVGLSESMKETYYYLKMVELHKTQQYSLTREKLIAKLNEFRKDAATLTFFDLITALSVLFEGKLQGVEEVLSINQARNCLEHRNGIVGDIDIKGGGDTFKLRYYSIRLSAEVNGQRKDILYKDRENTITVYDPIFYGTLLIKEFHKGDQLKFSSTDFNDIALTAANFVNQFSRYIPRPSQEKQ